MTRARPHLPTATASLAPLQVVARRAGLRALVHAQVSRPWWAQAALVWLLLALVVVPTLGRMHQVLHAPALQVHVLSPLATVVDADTAAGARYEYSTKGFSAAGTPAAGHTHPAHVQGHGVFNLLLAHHAPVDCLLLDQLALGDALHGAPAALATPVPAQAPLVHPAATAAARHVALFQARGPPALG